MTGSPARRTALGLGLALCALLATCAPAVAFPVDLVDSAGRRIAVERAPRRVVSLVPSATDAVFAIGAGDAVVGVTYHDSQPEARRRAIVGGFAAPSVEAIEDLEPDLVLATSYQARRLQRLSDRGIAVAVLDDVSLSDMYQRIRALGEVFDRRERAAEVIRGIEASLDRVAAKVAGVPSGERRRVIRLMGRETPMAPGDDSFQNEVIRAAGGIPPEIGKRGAVADLTEEEWRSFDPQVIYHCEGDEEIARRITEMPGWRDVEAVREGRIHRFPCDLTCRTTPMVEEFVPWLASTIYPELFGAEGRTVVPDRVLRRADLDLPLGYVSSAAVVDTVLLDFENRTLLMDLSSPMRVLSTLEGERRGVSTIANHYAPPPCWGALHELGPAGFSERLLGVLDRDRESASVLLTGADIENMAVRIESYRDLTVVALVTAGVAGNAMRASREEGSFYEPGTINAIVMTSARLTPRAMARAIVAATEAKTAALQDLDIRSSGDPLLQATGTGTDNVVVVEGAGPETVDGAGGHCKMGELISRAVHGAVTEAIWKQNGIRAGRSVFERLRERGSTPLAFVRKLLGPRAADAFAAAGELERLLLDERWASFVESSMALRDARDRALVSDLDAHRALCGQVASEIAGGGDAGPAEIPGIGEATDALDMAFSALLEGLVAAGRIDLAGGGRAGAAGGG